MHQLRDIINPSKTATQGNLADFSTITLNALLACFLIDIQCKTLHILRCKEIIKLN